VLFQKTCLLSWPEIVEEASRYVEPLEKIYPRYFEEIRGIAKGSGRGFLDILALNVRTEINFGLFTDTSKKIDVVSDGCTSLAWFTGGKSFLSQNWDWVVEQSQNLIVCHVSQPGTDIPTFSMVTEAGILGKIGLNSEGVGCCLNAIRCRGVDRTKMPIHFALRTVLESKSREQAIATIETAGIAGSGHILIGDSTGSTGLECTSKWVKQINMDEKGRVYHTNHLILDHSDVDEPPWLADSPLRLKHISQMTENMVEPQLIDIQGIFKDEVGYPASINRKTEGQCITQTLFNIVMDLSDRRAEVIVGRPTEQGEQFTLSF